MTPAEVAEVLRVRERLLYDWRARGAGPPWVKVGHYVRYDPVALQLWIDSERSGPR